MKLASSSLLFVALMPHNLGLEFLRESCCCSQTRHLGGENISMPTNAVRLALLNADDFSKFLERKKPKSFATLALHNYLTYAVRNNFRLGVLFHLIFAAF